MLLCFIRHADNYVNCRTTTFLYVLTLHKTRRHRPFGCGPEEWKCGRVHWLGETPCCQWSTSDSTRCVWTVDHWQHVWVAGTFRYFCHVWRPKRSNFTNTKGVTCNACFTSVALLIRSNIFPTQTWILSDVSGVELNKVLRTSFSAKPRHRFPMLCYLLRLRFYETLVTTLFL